MVVAATPVQAAELERTAGGDQGTAVENLYLIGRPKLKEFLRYVAGHAVNPPGQGTLTAEWNAANEIVRALEKEEAGLADDPPMSSLGPEYEPLLIEFLKDPLVRHGFNTVPTDVAMVELDRAGFELQLQVHGRTPDQIRLDPSGVGLAAHAFEDLR